MSDVQVAAIQVCVSCAKPYTTVNAYKRHVAYCRKAIDRPRKRHRSCQQCSAAKAKCSFQSPCSRCTLRNLSCSYNGVQVNESNPFIPSEDHSTDTTICLPTHHEVSAGMVVFPHHESVLFDEITAAEDPSEAHIELTALYDAVITNDFYRPHAEQSLVSTDLTSRKRFMRDTSGYLSLLPVATTSQPVVSHILDQLCAIPQQMLRRGTFPSFIHPRWGQPLPEALEICMHVAQMFSSRTPQLTPFIWRTILSETRRTLAKLESLATEDVHAIMQAHMVYMMMRLIDNSELSLQWNLEMTLALYTLCDRLLSLCGSFFEEEKTRPSLTWADWIFAESRRRTACVWMFFCRTIQVKTRVECLKPMWLPLPSPKTQWEARNEDEWLSETAFAGPELCTLGDLIDAKRNAKHEETARLIDDWNARADTLGTLVNSTTSFLDAVA